MSAQQHHLAHHETQQGSAKHLSEGVFFRTPTALPRGPHGLSRPDVLAVHREKMMIAATELLASAGPGGVGMREICARASTSRAAFYDCFTTTDECVFSAYQRFIDVLTRRLQGIDPHESQGLYFQHLLRVYVGTLEQDPVTARAFQVEMDSYGPVARLQRRQALEQLARVLQARHAEGSPSDAPAPLVAYLGALYAARQLISDALDTGTRDLQAIVPDIAAIVGQILTTGEHCATSI